MATILLVEDNEMNRDMLGRRLRRRGFTVLMPPTASRPWPAVRERPDLVLMDLSLPVLDGCEATRRLKQSPDTAAIPVLALTAHVTAADRERALAAGCADLDTKPIDLPRLLAEIERLLDGGIGHDG